MYFKAELEIITKTTNDERIMFIQASDIVKAMDITKKIRYSRFKVIEPISHAQYMDGVDKKYTNIPEA